MEIRPLTKAKLLPDSNLPQVAEKLLSQSRPEKTNHSAKGQAVEAGFRSPRTRECVAGWLGIGFIAFIDGKKVVR